MTDTTQAAAAAVIKRPTVAIRDWINPAGNPVEGGKETEAVAFRYTHLPTALRIKSDFNAETDAPPADAVYTSPTLGDAGAIGTMLAIFGGLTLAGNVVNTAVNGPKGDPNVNPIPLIKARFDELISGVWADRATGVGGVRYDKDKLAEAIATAKGQFNTANPEASIAPYLAKMDNKVDPKTGAIVPPDTKGAISYGAFALRNAKVKASYDALTGGGVQLDSI